MSVCVRSPAALLALAIGWGLSGCASWTPPTDAKSPLQTPRPPIDSVELDFRFVDIPPDFAADGFADWTGIDELHLDVELRRRLNANGFRCGVSGAQLPAWLQELVMQPPKTVDDIVSSNSDEPVTERVHSLQCRSGRPTRVVVMAKPRPELAILVDTDGTLSGETLRDAQAHLELKAYPQGDGQVRVELTPELEHGAARQRWIGEEGMFILDANRERRTFENLRLRATLAAGHVLVLGATEPPRGLGAQFFTDASQQGLRRRLYLLRFTKSQRDDRFDTDEQAAPLVPIDE